MCLFHFFNWNNLRALAWTVIPSWMKIITSDNFWNYFRFILKMLPEPQKTALVLLGKEHILDDD